LPFPWVRNISTWNHGFLSPESRLFGFIYGLVLVIALIYLLAGSPALADNECNPPPSGGGTITCSASTYTADPGGDPGIEYDLSNGDWVVNLEDNLEVDTTAGSDHTFSVYYDGTGSLAVNMLDGSLTTEGNDAHGIDVLPFFEENFGPVKIKMSGGEIETSGYKADGIHVLSYSDEDIDIGMVADDEDSIPSITAEGTNSNGIYAEHFASGDLNIAVSAQIDTTGSAGNGIYAGHFASGDIDIDLDGANMESNNAHAVIYADHDGTGGVNIRVRSYLVSDENALLISNSSTSPATITLESATIRAGAGSKAIVTESGNDFLKVTGGLNEITGEIDFGEGMDTMIFETADGANVRLTLMGDITGLENIGKIGTGAAHLSDISSPGSDMDIEAGDLYMNGHFDIGSGEFTIQDDSRVIFGNSTLSHGRITASQVKFIASDWQKLFVADGSLSTLEGRDVLNGDGRFRDNNGGTVEPKLYNNEDGTETGFFVTEDGIVKEVAAPSPPPEPEPEQKPEPESEPELGNTGDGGCSIDGSGNSSIATTGLLLFMFGLFMFLETGRKTRKKLKGTTVS